MSRILSPLFGLAATGSLADSITYVNGKRYNAVRSHFSPNQPNSKAQKTRRSMFRDCSSFLMKGVYTKTDLKAWKFLNDYLKAKGTYRSAFCKACLLAHPYVQWSFLYDLKAFGPPGQIFIQAKSDTGPGMFLFKRYGPGSIYKEFQPGLAHAPVTWGPYDECWDTVGALLLDVGITRGQSGLFRFHKSWFA